MSVAAKQLRVALLASEFASELSSGGGVAIHLLRLARGLQAMGHHVEVFVLSQQRPESLNWQGIPVHRIPTHYRRDTRLIWRIARGPLRPLHVLGFYLSVARVMRDAFMARHANAPFDVVLSTTLGVTGLKLPRSLSAVHLTLACHVLGLNLKSSSLADRTEAVIASWLERLQMRRCDVAYAPSRLVADDAARRFGLELKVVRTPFVMDCEPSAAPPLALPSRFLMHFGTLGRVKGTDVVADALLQAWEQEPELKMVWAGRAESDSFVEGLLSRSSRFRENVIVTGSIPRCDLYACLMNAECAVLPSRFDNLPNTLIESLFLRVPVIGTRGASFDEVIEPGVSGDLVEIGDAAGLADLMVKVWRREVRWVGEGYRRPAILAQMEPVTALASFLRAAGFSSDGHLIEEPRNPVVEPLQSLR